MNDNMNNELDYEQSFVWTQTEVEELEYVLGMFAGAEDQ